MPVSPQFVVSQTCESILHNMSVHVHRAKRSLEEIETDTGATAKITKIVTDDYRVKIPKTV